MLGRRLAVRPLRLHREASGSISGFAIGRDGALSALNTTVLVPSPRDLAFDESGRLLYAVSPGTATTGGQVTSYRVGHDGSLTQAGTAPAAAGITGAAVSCPGRSRLADEGK